MWRPGHKLVHPFNTELGTGVVRALEGRFLRVWFPGVDQEMLLSARDGGLRRHVLAPGAAACLLESDEEVEIAQALPDEDRYVLDDGREVSEAAVWPLTTPDTPIDRLATGRFDGLRAMRNRVEGLRLLEIREAGGLGSFLGGRIDLFPHQLHTALRATKTDPVRWLLADEVGLGKTIEACLILTALLRTGRAERALVVAPDTLVIQWLGELWRKFHQVFSILDQERVEAVSRVYDEDTNPFDVHPFAVVSLDDLAADERLRRLALEAGLDVVVVDEAHRLVGSGPAEATVGALVEQARHALLLTATPLQADRAGFHRLLSLLQPDAFPDFAAFEAAVDSGEAVVRCTSAVRRADVGGLPPRAPRPVDVGETGGPIAEDPRTTWLVEQAKAWALAGEKALVFVSDVAELEQLRKYVQGETHQECATFHERMSAEQRDIELARFRITAAPLLLCSEAGEEGRNFQFCDRMVHWDLPDDPMVLEQRIGRLDRIGRRIDVEVVYFRPPGDAGRHARLFERLGLFERPSAGLDAALSGVRPALAAHRNGGPLQEDALVEAASVARAAAERDVTRVLYADGYDGTQDDDVMGRVPSDLESAVEAFALRAAEDLGFDVIEKGGGVWYVELGANSRVDGLPGVPGGTRYLGTFDRATAVERTEIEFFASGHPLVEGLVMELEDGPRGRAAVLTVPHPTERGRGLFALLKQGAEWRGIAVDARGAQRPAWAQAVLEGLSEAKAHRPDPAELGPDWGRGVHGLAAALPAGQGEVVAVAFFSLAAGVPD